MPKYAPKYTFTFKGTSPGLNDVFRPLVKNHLSPLK